MELTTFLAVSRKEYLIFAKIFVAVNIQFQLMTFERTSLAQLIQSKLWLALPKASVRKK